MSASTSFGSSSTFTTGEPLKNPYVNSFSLLRQISTGSRTMRLVPSSSVTRICTGMTSPPSFFSLIRLYSAPRSVLPVSSCADCVVTSATAWSFACVV